MTRPIDRAQQPRRHVGPYYPREAMRRIIEPDVCDPSIIERITEAYSNLTAAEIRLMTVAIIACVFCAALIVIL